MKKVRIALIASQTSLLFSFIKNAFAQSATSSSSVGGGGATSSALPNAGAGELTYLFFFGGVALFVFGMMKLVSSYRD